MKFGQQTKKLHARMLTHTTGHFSGDYISALQGVLPTQIFTQDTTPKLYFPSNLERRVASIWALPHISSLQFFWSRPCIVIACVKRSNRIVS